MANQHGTNTKLHVSDSSAASQDLSGDLNNVTLSWSRNNAIVTALGDNSVQRISGLRDATITATVVWNSGTNAATCVIGGLMGASAITLVKWMPAGCITGCLMWTGCFLPSAYDETGPIDGAVGATFTLQLASGSLSASTV